MIQFRLRELMARKQRTEGRRITYGVITRQTKISPSTLSRMANNDLGMVGLSVIDRLCGFFPCNPGDLIVHVGSRRRAQTTGGGSRAAAYQFGGGE